MRTLVRIQPWGWRGRGVADVAPVTSSAAARAGAVATELESEIEKGEKVAELTAVT